MNASHAQPGAELHCCVELRTEVGEGPVWDERAGLLYWIDITGDTLFRYDTC